MENIGKTHNVIVFGQSRTGKSTIINKITESEDCEVSNKAHGCTVKCQKVEYNKKGQKFSFYDSPGLGEHKKGKISNKKALLKLLALFHDVDKNGGPSLLIFVFRHALSEKDQESINLFYYHICEGKVNMITIITDQECAGDDDPPILEIFREPMDGISDVMRKNINEVCLVPSKFIDKNSCQTEKQFNLINNNQELVKHNQLLETKSKIKIWSAIDNNVKSSDKIPVLKNFLEKFKFFFYKILSNEKKLLSKFDFGPDEINKILEEFPELKKKTCSIQ